MTRTSAFSNQSFKRLKTSVAVRVIKMNVGWWYSGFKQHFVGSRLASYRMMMIGINKQKQQSKNKNTSKTDDAFVCRTGGRYNTVNTLQTAGKSILSTIYGSQSLTSSLSRAKTQTPFIQWKNNQPAVR
jgi:hypothetical protein